MERWRNSKDPAERERIWIAVNAIEQIKGKLQTVMSNGKLSRKELDGLTGAKTKRFGVV